MDKILLSHKELGCLHKDKEIIGTSVQLILAVKRDF